MRYATLALALSLWGCNGGEDDTDPVDDTMDDTDDTDVVDTMFDPAILLFGFDFALDDAGTSVAWSVNGADLVTYFAMILADDTGAACQLVYALDSSAFAAAGATETGVAELGTWLTDQGLLFGFQVLPGGYTPATIGPTGGSDCNMDDVTFTAAPHSGLLGDGLFVGIKADPTSTAETAWTEFGFAAEVPVANMLGGDIRLPTGAVLSYPDVNNTDLGAVAFEVDGSMEAVTDMNNALNPLDPDDVTTGGTLARAWYQGPTILGYTLP